MVPFVRYRPTKMVFGPGQINHFHDHLKNLGRKALIVTGQKAMERLGYLDIVKKQLGAAGISWAHFRGIEPNPRCTTIDEAARVLRQEACDFIIALGGGSVMDACKGIALMGKNEGRVWDYVTKQNSSPVQGAVPLVTIPSVAATGSEVNSLGVITNWETHQKLGLSNDFLFPVLAVIDPELTCHVPEQTTVDGGVDIFIHAAESYFGQWEYNSWIQDRFTEGIFLTVREALKRVLDNPGDIDARSQLCQCSTWAMQGIHAGREVSYPLHIMEHPLSGRYDLAHGRGLALILIAKLRWDITARPKMAAAFGRNCLQVDSNLGDEDAAAAAVNALAEWLKAIGFRETLKDLGVEREALETLADTALKNSDTPGKPLSNCRPIDREGALWIYRESF